MPINTGTGQGQWLSSIQHVSDGEPASEVVLRRPSQDLENRTLALRTLTESIESSISGANTTLSNRIGQEVSDRANGDTTLSNRIGQEVSDRMGADTTLSNRIGQESSDRSNADSTLSNRIGQEVSDRTNSDTSAATRIGTEETTRGLADTTLSNRIGQEVSDRTNADTTLQNNINTEATTRGLVDTTLSNRIGQEVSDRTSSATTLQNNINIEATTRGLADTTLSNRIGQEVSDRSTADSSLSDRIDAVASTLSWRPGVKAATQDTAWLSVADGTALSSMPNAATKLLSDDDHTVKLTAADFVAGDYILTKNGTSSKLYQIRDLVGLKIKVVSIQPRQNDTWVVRYDLPDVAGSEETAIYTFDGGDLIKLADFDWNTATSIGVQDNNSVFTSTTVESVLYELYTGTQTVKTNSQLADTTLSNRIGQEVSDRTTADTSLATRIGTEETTRGLVDTTLSNRIGQEVSDRTTGDTSLTTRIGTEETTRGLADTTLSNRIGQEVSDRTNSDTSASNRIGQEVSDRTNADTTLQNNINTEVTTRGLAETTLSNRIGQEVSDRTAADTSLSNRLGGIPFNKTVGAGGTYATLTAASLVAGDRVLVVGNYSISAAETISANDVYIMFQPGVTITTTSSAQSLIITGSRVDVINPNYSVGATQTAAIYVNGGNDCVVEHALVSNTTGTLTASFQVNAGTRNAFSGTTYQNGGTITNKYLDAGTQNEWRILGDGASA